MKNREIHRLAAQMKQIRTLRGLTQAQLGAAVGLPNQSVARIELGQWLPTVRRLDELLAPLGYELAIVRKHAGDGRRGHPAVRTLAVERAEQGKTYCWLAETTGVARSAIVAWAGECEPLLTNVDSCFNALGLELRPVWRG